MHEDTHYAQVTALLLAGDVQARVVSNDDYMGVEVKAGDKRIVWGNGNEVWGWTAVSLDGTIASGQSTIPADAAPEDVAQRIATEDYEADTLYESADRSETVGP